MMNILLIASGGAVLLCSLIYYAWDCSGNVSSTMGGNMSFSAYWTVGSIPFCLGLCPYLQVSRWWSVIGVLVLYIASFPFRSFIERSVCIPLEKEASDKNHHIKPLK